MPFSAEDLAQLGEFIESKVKTEVEAVKADVQKAVPEVEEKAAAAGSQAADQVAEFFVHLADGSVVTLPQNEISSHVDVDGKPVQVIAKYRVGA